MFSHYQIEAFHFWQENHRSDVLFLVHHIRGYLMSIRLITSNINIDHMVKVVSGIFPFENMVLFIALLKAKYSEKF